MNLSITPTLLDAFDWYNNAPNTRKKDSDLTWKQAALAELIGKVQRTSVFEPTIAIKKGIEFEDAVQAFCEGRIQGGSAKFHEVASECQGGLFQTWCEGYVTTEQGRVRLYGKRDVVLPERVVDIKTTGSYRGKDKYLGGWQHHFYCFCSDIPAFRYIIAEWDDPEDDDNRVIKAVHKVDHVVTSMEAAQAKITKGIETFFAFLNTKGLWDDYVYTFCKNPRQ